MTTPQPHPLMAVLTAGVPLSLLVDLATEDGPDSARIFRREVADTSWLAGLWPAPATDEAAGSAASADAV